MFIIFHEITSYIDFCSTKNAYFHVKYLQDFLGEFTLEERRLLQNLLVTLSGRKQFLLTTDENPQFDREAEN